MVAAHYQRPHRVICVTDDARGIYSGIKIVPPWGDFEGLASPHGGMHPSCYRRLRAFHPDIAEVFGSRFVCLDLDVVLVADVAPLWDRPDDFVAYRDPLFPRQYNGSMLLLRAGARPGVWDDFDPLHSPRAAGRMGYRGSDQAWISYRLPGEATWGREDGVLSYRRDVHPNGGNLPDGARVVFFHGRVDPWSDEAQRLDWVREHWGVAAHIDCRGHVESEPLIGNGD